MVLSKACEYGLRSAIYVALRGDDSFVRIRTISDELGISFHFLTKILQQLSGAGLMESFRGPAGGIRLARPAGKITLKDIVIAVDGRSLFEECVLGLPGCGDQAPCPLHSQWSHQRGEIDGMLSGTTLADVARMIASGGLRIGDKAVPNRGLSN